MTAVFEQAASGGLVLRDAMGSHKELIQQFCFGLLETFGLAQLRTSADDWRKAGTF